MGRGYEGCWAVREPSAIMCHFFYGRLGSVFRALILSMKGCDCNFQAFGWTLIVSFKYVHNVLF